jgi:osmotically-inducible protein OsmY
MTSSKRKSCSHVQRQGDEDVRLRERIEALIEGDSVVILEDIQVKVRDGRVRLTGVVASDAWRERLEGLIATLPEVRSLETDMHLERRLHMSPRQMISKLQERLVETFTFHREIGLDYEDGALTISGRVDTLRQRMDLEAWAVALPGVHQLQNRVRVGYDSLSDDQTLKQKVQLTISGLGQQGISDLKWRVSRGVVTLRGQALHLSEKDELLRAVASVKGVKEIVDEIELDERESDRADLRQRIELAFREEPLLLGSRIRFDLAGGTLFLRGEVRSSDQLVAIEETLSDFPEVRRVVNELLLAQ